MPHRGKGVERMGKHTVRKPSRRRSTGQSILEYEVLVAGVASAVIVMSSYVKRAFDAHAEAVEEELNGATDDNLP